MSASWGKPSAFPIPCQPEDTDLGVAVAQYVISINTVSHSLLIFLALFNRCNTKQSCTFDGSAGCSILGCGADDSFSNYFGNPCPVVLKCLSIEYVCQAPARKKREANINGSETGQLNFKWIIVKIQLLSHKTAVYNKIRITSRGFLDPTLIPLITFFLHRSTDKH